MNTINKLLAKIEARAQRATPGPCEVVRFDNVSGSIAFQVEYQTADEHTILGWHNDLRNPRARFEAEFEAHARTDIPRLLKALRLALPILEEQAHAENTAFLYQRYASEALAEIERTLRGE
jgi:hypothetical protein